MIYVEGVVDSRKSVTTQTQGDDVNGTTLAQDDRY